MTDEYGRSVGWKPDTDLIMNITLQPGQTEHVGPWEKPGWMRCLGVYSDNPYVRVSQNIYSIEKPFEWDFFTLFVYGENRPGPGGSLVYLEKYDVVNNIYKMIYQPQPVQEFLAKSDVLITLPTRDPFGNAITTAAIISHFHQTILIDNVAKFTAKLQEVLGTRRVTL